MTKITMNANQVLSSSASVLLAGVVAISAAPFAAQAQQPTVKVDGSSTVFPIMEVAAAEFQKANAGTRVTVGVSGTGAGFRKFCAGETDISNASRPITAKEMGDCKKNGISYVELPIAYDGLAVVVHPQNTWTNQLTLPELKAIWEPGSKISNWSQVRPGFPNRPLKLFGAGAASGTFDYFTEAVNGKSKAIRTDFTPSEDDNVLVQGVSRDTGAMGFFGKAYVEENKGRIKAVPIVPPGKTTGVLPTDANVQSGAYTPLSRPLFIYVSTKAAARPEVSRFVSFTIQNGAKLAKEAKYVAFPARAYTQIATKFTGRRTGTIFGGKEEIGLTIDELLKREAKE
ncbi:MAG: PstS family phosphate ABC transporter substrate-binding protein [Pseudanabaenaceae cyanobacterium bins.68]|nr:PstS family phosphate ABC transporter substrate-binding protein [Pseudanabaenaceae cyanobacterium bins.68]